MKVTVIPAVDPQTVRNTDLNKWQRKNGPKLRSSEYKSLDSRPFPQDGAFKGFDGNF